MSVSKNDFIFKFLPSLSVHCQFIENEFVSLFGRFIRPEEERLFRSSVSPDSEAITGMERKIIILVAVDDHKDALCNEEWGIE